MIRYYQSSDYPMLIRLLGKVYDSHIDQTTLEQKYLSKERSILVVMSDDDFLIGCAFLEVQVDYVRPSRILYITYVAVDEAYRKQGIGRQIFEKIENICKDEKCSAVELTSADFRTEAHMFYNHIGFSKKKTTLFIKEI